MREIKFRAWDKKNNRMVSVRGFSNFDEEDDYAFKYIVSSHGTIQYLEMELMQFTGLKDKNGKEIYEGDVLLVAGRIKYVVSFMNEDKCESACNNDPLLA